MPDLFRAALDFLWRPENDGQAYHVTQGDAGGATSWGVTFGTWIAWRQLHGIDGRGGTLAEFSALRPDDFLAFWRSAFWNPVHGDTLPPGIGLLVFDSAAMSGVSRAARWLQRMVGATQDGAIGPLTLAAVAAADPTDLIDRYTHLRADYLRAIASNSPNQKFLNGWLRRARDGQIGALAASIAARAPATAAR